MVFCVKTGNCTQTKETHVIRAELYKLNASSHKMQAFPYPLTFCQVYEVSSGKFKAHVDTPRSKYQVASLVVYLPSVHEGGQLVLRTRAVRPFLTGLATEVKVSFSGRHSIAIVSMRFYKLPPADMWLSPITSTLPAMPIQLA